MKNTIKQYVKLKINSVNHLINHAMIQLDLRKHWRVIVPSLAIGSLIAIIGFIYSFAPRIIQHTLTAQLQHELQRPVHIQQVSINWRNLSLTLNGIHINNQPNASTPDLLTVAQLQVQFSSESFQRFAPIIRQLTLVRPNLHIQRLKTDSHIDQYTISDIIARQLAKPASPTPRFALHNIQVEDAQLSLVDDITHTSHQLKQLAIRIPFISTMPSDTPIWTTPTISGQLDGQPLAIHIKTQQPQKTTATATTTTASTPSTATSTNTKAQSKLTHEITLDWKQLPLAPWLALLGTQQPFTLPSETQCATCNRMDGILHLTFEQGHATQQLLLSGNLDWHDVRLRQHAAPNTALVAQQLHITIDKLNPFSRQANQLTLTGQRLALDQAIHIPLQWHDIALDISQLNLSTTTTSSNNPTNDNAKDKLKDNTPNNQIHLAWRSPQLGQLTWQGTLTPSFSTNTSNSTATTAQRHTIANPSGYQLTGQLDITQTPITTGQSWLQPHLPNGWRNMNGQLALHTQVNATFDDNKPPIVALQNIQLALTQGQIELAPALTLTNITANIKNAALNLASNGALILPISTNMPVQLGGTLTHQQQRGTLDLNGTLSTTVAQALTGTTARGIPATQLNWQLNAQQLPLTPLQHYLGDQFNIALQHGQLNSTLTGTWTTGDTTQPLTQTLRMAGDASLQKLLVLDRHNQQDWLRAQTIDFKRMTWNGSAMHLTMDEIALDTFYTKLILNRDGRLNIEDLRVSQQDGQRAITEPTNAPKITEVGTEAIAQPVLPPTTIPAITPTAAPFTVEIGKVSLYNSQVDFTDNFVTPNYSANVRELTGTISTLSNRTLAADHPPTMTQLNLRGSVENAPLVIKGQFNAANPRQFTELTASAKGLELTDFNPYAGKYAGYEIDKGKLSVDVTYRIKDGILEAQNRVFLDQLTFGDKVDSPHATSLPVLLAVALLKNSKGEIDINLPIGGSLNDPDFSLGDLIWKVIGNLMLKAVSSPFSLLASLVGDSQQELSGIGFAPHSILLTDATTTTLKTLAKALAERPTLKLDIVGTGNTEALAQQRAKIVRDWLVDNGAVDYERIFLINPKVDANAEGTIAPATLKGASASGEIRTTPRSDERPALQVHFTIHP
jgi:hypothetical protein